MKNNLLFKSATAFMITAAMAGTVIPATVYAGELHEGTTLTDNSEEYIQDDFFEETCPSDESQTPFTDDDQFSDEAIMDSQDTDYDDSQDEYVEDTQDEFTEDIQDDESVREDIDANTDDIDSENEELSSEDIDYNNYEFDFASGNVVIEYDFGEDMPAEDISDEDFIDFDSDCCVESTSERAPAIDMSFYHTFIGYHGTRVDYNDLVPGKYYLMQIPKKGKVPTFSFCVIKFKKIYTNKGIIFDDVMATYDKYDADGNLVARNRKTQVNTNLLNMTPNHFYEITDDILAK